MEPEFLYKENKTDENSLKEAIKKTFEGYKIYQSSIQSKRNTVFFIVKNREVKNLVLFGNDEYFNLFDGKEATINKIVAKTCGLNHMNCESIRTLFPYTKPVTCGCHRFSMGLGDRLGIATPGHIYATKDYDVFLVLAQQSIRELNFTGRTYESVLDDVCWAVFQEGYTKGFGADGDHLKIEEHIKMAINAGYTMITLDCSDYIENKYYDINIDELYKAYNEIPEDKRRQFEERYLDRRHEIDEIAIDISRETLMRCILIYGKALDFIERIYRDIIGKNPYKLDFEVSIDETIFPTSPEVHLFIASELKKRGIVIQSLAPRFCGEFQKGIDYIGDVEQFEKEFIIHSNIAKHFGYRISVHSGSDKYNVFPYIGKYSGFIFHIKTAGTNWLEAVRLIAAKNPSLYRKMHRFALSKLEEAKKYYHIGAKPENIADIDTLNDNELPALMDENDARQVLHITYGFILKEKDNNGDYLFRDEIYEMLERYEDEYALYLERLMHKHLKMLGINKD